MKKQVWLWLALSMCALHVSAQTVYTTKLSNTYHTKSCHHLSEDKSSIDLKDAFFQATLPVRAAGLYKTQSLHWTNRISMKNQILKLRLHLALNVQAPPRQEYAVHMLRKAQAENVFSTAGNKRKMEISETIGLFVSCIAALIGVFFTESIKEMIKKAFSIQSEKQTDQLYWIILILAIVLPLLTFFIKGI